MVAFRNALDAHRIEFLPDFPQQSNIRCGHNFQWTRHQFQPADAGAALSGFAGSVTPGD